MKAKDFLLPGDKVTTGTSSVRGAVRISGDTNDIGEDVALSTAGGKKLEEGISSAREEIKNKNGFYIGQAVWSPSRNYPLNGMLPADGQLIDRKIHADLFELVATGKLPSVSEEEWQRTPSKRGSYSLGDGSTTFRIPDYNGKSSGSLGRVFLSGDGKGSAITNGEIQGDAIRNITGAFATIVPDTHLNYGNGCISGDTVVVNGGKPASYSVRRDLLTSETSYTDVSNFGYSIDAGRQVPVADENRPRNVTGCFFICFAGAALNTGGIDALELARRIAELEESLMKRQGHYVGETLWHPQRTDIPSGALPADGQLVDRGMYPDLFNKITKGELPVVTEADWLADPYKRGFYTIGDGSTSFRLPDYNGKSAGSIGRIYFAGDGKLAATGNGNIEKDAIRNITGHVDGRTSGTVGKIFDGTGAGAFVPTGVSGKYAAEDPRGWEDGGTDRCSMLNFDASKSVPTGADNHPTTISGCMIIFHAGSPTNFGTLDVMKMAELVTNLKNEVGKFSGFNLGDVVWTPLRSSIGVGRIAADGQLLPRGMYPSLFDEIAKGNVPTVPDSEWLNDPSKRGCYTLGDGVTNFRVPDYNGISNGSLGRVFLSGDGKGASKSGDVQGDAIRNITGKMDYLPSSNSGATADFFGLQSGAFNPRNKASTNLSRPFSEDATTTKLNSILEFDASKVVPTAAENQPRNVSGCYVIIGAGRALDAGVLDAMYVAQELERTNAEFRKMKMTHKRVGEIYFSAFREGNGEYGEYLANGDKYPIDSTIGRALKALPEYFKSDWKIIESGGKISMPNMFYTDGRGMFVRAGLKPGVTELDGQQKFEGSIGGYPYISNAAVNEEGVSKTRTGAFVRKRDSYYGRTFYTVKPDSLISQQITEPLFPGAEIDISTQVRTADENRPVNVRMYPVIYLGV